VILLGQQDRTEIQIGIDAADLLKISKEHGRGRAGMPAYIMSQVITEYQILREVIFRFLEEHQCLTLLEREMMTSLIEDAVNVAATEFALVIRELQDQFMLSVAHDLKSPVSAVKVGAELIRSHADAQIAVPLADKMIVAMKRMTDMIEELHDKSRVAQGRALVLSRSECDLDAIIRDVASDMSLVFGDFFVVVSNGSLRGLWNPEYLRRLMENLVSNAAKFREPGTSVTLTLSHYEEDAVIEVHNLGEPISPSEQAGLFKLAGRVADPKILARSQKGWGLGLVLVKAVVDALDGSVGVESTPGKGTTFTVRLPVRMEPAQGARKAG